MEEKYYELTDEFKVNDIGVKLSRIKCIRKIKYAEVGDLGGFIEKEDNLYGEAWVFGNAQVSDNAQVFGNARVSDNAEVFGDARVFGDAWVSGNARVFGDAWVSDNAEVSGNARVCGDAEVFGDARVFGDAWVSDNAEVSGNARVCGDARIDSNDKHCGFDLFGSANRHTHAYLTKENKIEVTCGCFKGSIEEFEKRVEDTHNGNQYEKQYKAIINVIKIKFNI